jgi:hypothetical protein
MSQKNSLNQKHKTKKYLNLLKNANNTAFIGLVIQNLTAEVKQNGVVRADKLLKLVRFALHNILRCQDQTIKNREFARLKVQEALVPMILEQLDTQSSFESLLAVLVQGLNSQDAAIKAKWIKKVDLYQGEIEFDVDLLRNNQSSKAEEGIGQHLFRRIQLTDVVGSSDSLKSNLHSLMTDHRFLLRDNSDKLNLPGLSNHNVANNGSTGDVELTKDQLLQELDQIEGEGSFKLSDFIDKSFLESCLAPVTMMEISTDLNRAPLSDFIASKSTSILPLFTGNSAKRAKTDREATASQASLLVLSPCLALLLNYIGYVTHDTWEIRQAALSGLASLITTIASSNSPRELYFATLSCKDGTYSVAQSKKVMFDELLQMVLPMSVLLMLKDQFSDYEDLNVLTPVRFQGTKVIQSLCKYTLRKSASA